MKRIKIFVSNRIDIDSVQINNSLYEPIACGAVFADKNLFMQGDNAGENISNLRDMLGEFTVQYWAWKNEDLDYYGLCHYRRYLVFSDKKFKRADYQQMCQEAFIEPATIGKYNLANEKYMIHIITDYDVIVNEEVNVSKLWTPEGIKNTVYAHWAAHDGVFIDKRMLPILLELIRNKFPEYYEAACEYMSGKMHRGYNCYVMKKTLFRQLNHFQFSIIFALKECLEDTGILDRLERSLGYAGEIMYGIYIHALKKQGCYRIKELQLVYFEQTVFPDNIISYHVTKMLFYLKKHTEKICYFIYPKGSYRRKAAKRVYAFCIADRKR